MLNLEGIINRIEQKDFEELSARLMENKAEKYNSLLNFYRNQNITEQEMLEKLEVNPNAFYVLKSRLFDKVQKYLLENVEDPKTEILRKVTSIPSLVYNTQPEIAIAILTKLEKDLLTFDMPHELTSVYQALKTLHLHTDKYYDYAQQYNKHVAYTLSLDKAEDLLQNFVTQIGEYFTTRKDEILNVFPLIKDEINNIWKLYDSHHLTVLKNIIDVSTALFLPLPDLVKNDEPVEDILEVTRKIFEKYPNDLTYKYLEVIIDYLQFEYYHNLGITKKEKSYYDNVNKNLERFMTYNHTVFVSKFLKTKVDFAIKENITENLWVENEFQLENIEVSIEDIPNFINFSMYKATSAYYVKKYDVAIKEVNNLINEISFKKYAHSEVEVKLFLTLLYCLSNKYDLAWNTLRSANRKIRDINTDLSYENAIIFSKLLKVQVGTQKANSEQKVRQLRDRFNILNTSKSKMLDFLKLDDNFINEFMGY